MPPAQCPECGRFLARGFVQNLATEPADCPKCGFRLSSAHFPEVLGQAAAPDAPVEEPAAAAELRDGTTPDPDPASVRPPDLDPGEVRVGDDGRPDPLEGWDRDADVVEGARAIGFTLGMPGVGMLGLVEDILVDRAFIEQRSDSAAELVTVDARKPLLARLGLGGPAAGGAPFGPDGLLGMLQAAEVRATWARYGL